MWAKLAVILYLFSFLLLIIGLWVEDATNHQIFPNRNLIQQRLESQINAQRLDPNNVNAGITYIFGDYLSAARILFGVVTGEAVFFVLQQIPIFANYYVYIIITILYTFSTVMLVVYIIGNRVL